MNKLEIIDQGNNKISVQAYIENKDKLMISNKVKFVNVIEKSDIKQIRWYLEEYLQFPYGAEIDKAKQIEKRMKDIGRRLFDNIFIIDNNNSNTCEIYKSIFQEGLSSACVSIISNNPQFLSIPWELLYDSTNNFYLALEASEFYRKYIKDDGEKLTNICIEKEKINILIIISRPEGDKDIPFGAVVKHIVYAMSFSDRAFQIELLRPSTLEKLKEVLKNKNYDIIHFDGHGIFIANKEQANYFYDEYNEELEVGYGYLVFENKYGGKQFINSIDLGRVLQNSGVSTFILNACHSATEDDDLVFSSVASQLLQNGINNVVAMSGLVHKEMIAIFMEQLYLQIISGKSIAKAFSIARRKIASNKFRECSAGLVELNDWIVPILYKKSSSDVTFKATCMRTIPLSIMAVNRIGDLKQEYNFVGRDLYIFKLERALLNNKEPWILVNGGIGVGKTEIVLGFVQWYMMTGGNAKGIYYISFKDRINFFDIIISIIEKDSELVDDKEIEIKQLAMFFRKNKYILILDDFENLTGYPYDNNKKSISKFLDFLKMLKYGETRVFIISKKSSEKFLEISCKNEMVYGLNTEDSVFLIRRILNSIGKDLSNYIGNREFYTLIRLLNGHPYSMKEILLQLDKKSPRQLVRELIGVDKPFKRVSDISLINLFNNLNIELRELLMFISYHCVYINSYFIQEFVCYRGSDDSVYNKIFGTQPSKEDIKMLLEKAYEIGIIGKKIKVYKTASYTIYPTFQVFLREELIRQMGHKKLLLLEKYFIKFYYELCSVINIELYKHNEDLYVLSLSEQYNISSALYLSIKWQMWNESLQLIQSIGKIYNYSNNIEEIINVYNSILIILNGNINKENYRFWLHVNSNLAEIYSKSSDLNEVNKADKLYDEMIDNIFSKSEDNKKDIAVIYFQKSVICIRKRDFNEAREYINKSLKLRIELNLMEDIAYCYYNLGLIEKEESYFDKAIDYFDKIIDISKSNEININILYGVFIGYGNIKIEMNDFESAEEYFWKGYEIIKAHEQTMLNELAVIYHSLAIAYEGMERLEDAEKLYKKSIDMLEDKKVYKYQVLSIYHQLGMLYEKMKLFEDSERWLRKCIDERIELGFYYEAASTCHELGVTKISSGNLKEAEECFEKSLELYGENESQKSETYFQLAYIKFQDNDINESLSYCRIALEIAIKYNRVIKNDIEKLIFILMSRKYL